jgi:hypothetical protein
MRKLILVAAVLVCAALGISAQDSLRNRGYADWSAYRQVKPHFEESLNWNSPVAVFFRQGTPDEGAPPPPPPDGWRQDGSPAWFTGGEVHEYVVHYREADWEQPFMRTKPIGPVVDVLRPLYSGPEPLTSQTPSIPWPYAANVADDFATAYGVAYRNVVYEWAWRVDWSKLEPFDPFVSTGIRDWLRHMGRKEVLTKWHYSPLSSGDVTAVRFSPQTLHAYVRLSVNRRSRDFWISVRVIDGDPPRNFCHGFYVSAYYADLF